MSFPWASPQNSRAAYMRKWYADLKQKDPEKYDHQRRKHRLKRKYGITPEEYEAMLASQGGRCALCDRRPDQERYGHLSVDHCHATGRVRGLLCTVHNSAVAAFGDDETGLLRALAYVKRGV